MRQKHVEAMIQFAFRIINAELDKLATAGDTAQRKYFSNLAEDIAELEKVTFKYFALIEKQEEESIPDPPMSKFGAN